jgi:cytochrome P450
VNSNTLLESALANGALEINPYPVYRALHETGHRHVFTESWNAPVFFKYADVTDILRRPVEFSNRGRVANHLKRAFPAEATGELKPLADHYSAGLINSDPPDHTRLRQLIQQAFLPRMLEQLRPRVDEICADLFSRLRKKSDVEFVADFAFQLPVTVIAEMLGIPHGMRDQFKDWSLRIVEFMASPNPPLDAMRRSQAALLELRAYFSAVFDERRNQPGEDVISILVNASESGDKLTEEEVLSTCVTLLIGGHETTTALLTSSLWLIGTDPDLRADLLSHPDQLPSAVEEFLRVQPPFHRILRVVASDMEFAGLSLHEGQTVILLLGAANRDGGQFPDPDLIDIRRSPNKHASFGYGMHHCPGAGLARLEAPAALGHLLRAFPDFQCEAEPQWHDGMVRSIKRLEIRL